MALALLSLSAVCGTLAYGYWVVPVPLLRANLERPEQLDVCGELTRKHIPFQLDADTVRVTPGLRAKALVALAAAGIPSHDLNDGAIRTDERMSTIRREADALLSMRGQLMLDDRLHKGSAELSVHGNYAESTLFFVPKTAQRLSIMAPNGFREPRSIGEINRVAPYELNLYETPPLLDLRGVLVLHDPLQKRTAERTLSDVLSLEGNDLQTIILAPPAH
jgi:hypothetical protein